MRRQKASASSDSRSYGSCSVEELHGKCWFWTLYKLLPVEPIGLLGAGAAVCYSDSSPMAPWVIATGCLFSLSSTRAPQNLILLLNVLCQGYRPSLFLLIIFLGPKLLFFRIIGSKHPGNIIPPALIIHCRKAASDRDSGCGPQRQTVWVWSLILPITPTMILGPLGFSFHNDKVRKMVGPAV